MTKIDAWMILLLVCGFLGAISIQVPAALGDKNKFLGDFVNHEFLNFMGVMVTITLASTANIHMELRKKERDAGEDFLKKTRKAVRRSAFSLVLALVFSVILVVIKPLLPSSDVWSAFANSTALVVILWGVLVIYDVTKLAFRI